MLQIGIFNFLIVVAVSSSFVIRSVLIDSSHAEGLTAAGSCQTRLALISVFTLNFRTLGLSNTKTNVKTTISPHGCVRQFFFNLSYKIDPRAIAQIAAILPHLTVPT